jgi:hypothetical protein
MFTRWCDTDATHALGRVEDAQTDLSIKFFLKKYENTKSPPPTPAITQKYENTKMPI